MERLRQEVETFEQRKRQEERWFTLRLTMGYSAVILLFVITAISTFVIANYDKFTTTAVTAAVAALFVDVLGLMIAVWKIVLNPTFVSKLVPVTVDPGAPDETQ